MSTKIRVIIRSFDFPHIDKILNSFPPNTKKVNLPEKRVVYTVLRSPHVHKKSREQFEMRFKKKVVDIKADRHELRNKFFWFQRQRFIDAECEFQFFYKTRLSEEALSEIKNVACR